MNEKSIFWLSPIIIMTIGLFPMPYGYYTITRLVVSGCSIYYVYQFKQNNDQTFMWVFGFIAILYNPIIPIHLYEKVVWIPVNIITGILFFMKRHNSQ